ncbi:unnamed protein product [Spirodela intermedia]|uniref:Uncharacterized protein n=1 Tax=Spirodela intermedia TaxID=51605 RepID=A0ABN7EBC4_SPIIN|nr:unnamed protein product [Spirodela intermedia]
MLQFSEFYFFYFFSCCSKLNKMQTHVLNRPTA